MISRSDRRRQQRRSQIWCCQGLRIPCQSICSCLCCPGTVRVANCLSWLTWLKSGATGAVQTGQVVNVSAHKNTQALGQPHVKTLLTALVAPTIVTVPTRKVAPGVLMQNSFQLRYALRLIRLTESFAQVKRQQHKSSQQVSPQRYHSGNAEGLWLSPQIYGRCDNDA